MSKFKFVKKSKPVKKETSEVYPKPTKFKKSIKKPVSKEISKPAPKKSVEPQVKTYKEHQAKWKDCVNCDLCASRQKVVFLRGTIPCEVLFIAEAPGFSEDVIGKPMVGPAGKLMDHIIEQVSKTIAPSTVSWAITNLVSCIPLGDDGAKTAEPSDESIHECSKKLYELITIAKPKAIIFVGKLAAKHVSPIEIKLRRNEPPISEDSLYTSIDHPAFILRSDISFQELLIQRAVATVTDVFTEITIPF